MSNIQSNSDTSSSIIWSTGIKLHNASHHLILKKHDVQANIISHVQLEITSHLQNSEFSYSTLSRPQRSSGNKLSGGLPWEKIRVFGRVPLVKFTFHSHEKHPVATV